MSHVPTLLSRNATYARDQHTTLSLLPRVNAIVISCMDARTDPAHLLGVSPGELLVIRNAGGRVTPEVEQQIALILAIFRRAAGPDALIELILIHHTDCGMERLSKPGAAQALSNASGIPATALEQLAISHPSSSLTDDLQRLRSSALLPPGLPVSGLLFAHDSGRADVVFSEVL